MALTSLLEVQNQLLISKDLGYIGLQKYQLLSIDILSIHKMTNGLIKSASNRN